MVFEGYFRFLKDEIAADIKVVLQKYIKMTFDRRNERKKLIIN